MRHGSDKADRASISFSEEVAGYIDFDETRYQAAFRAGEAAGRRLALQLRITADDVDRCIAEERALARVTGWVRGDALGGPLEIEQGDVHLAVRADGTRRMDYRLQFHDGAGRPVTFVGFKEIRGSLEDAPPALRARLVAGHVDAAIDTDAPVVATGILQLPPNQFAKQVSSFRVSPPLRLDALARFGVLFAGDLWETYR